MVITEALGCDAEARDLHGATEEMLWAEAGDWLRRMHAPENDWLGDINPDGTPQTGPETMNFIAIRG